MCYIVLYCDKKKCTACYCNKYDCVCIFLEQIMYVLVPVKLHVTAEVNGYLGNPNRRAFFFRSKA